MGMFGLGVFQILFFLIFALVLSVFIISLVRGIKREHRNNQSPRLTVEATVVTKRMQVGNNVHNNGDMVTHSAYSKYYATFQFASGDRLELPVTGSEYGMLIEGDHGMLSFQGTRYLGFERRQTNSARPQDERSL